MNALRSREEGKEEAARDWGASRPYKRFLNAGPAHVSLPYPSRSKPTHMPTPYQSTYAASPTPQNTSSRDELL
ncbi:hypothetical protein E2C01_084178 [Portunus trituberculatus]|uniref:Uncharacterized protein n=1 Tax=Portunus trituberculatus TaxID=210409 RepID=A0A5B7IUL7_PORTR|nr:hypothetical protein [Portunus trituberculatus]